MFHFSHRSRAQLDTCHDDLQRLFKEVIKHFDCTIIEGFREKEAQQAAFEAGKSKLQWPQGKHNRYPSIAVDVAPYPIEWDNLARFRYFGGFVLGVAARMNIKVRWGGDWDRDHCFKDQSFDDLVHFELEF